MTKISLIHAVPQGEYADRGREVKRPIAIPYLSLTEGEMQLDLLRQRLALLNQFYPEDKTYSMGLQMVNSALQSGLHRGVNFVGSLADELQPIARIILKSARFTSPAAGRLYGRVNTVSGIGEAIPISDRRRACLELANQASNPITRASKKAACELEFDLEKIFNDKIEAVGHHMVYKGINEAYKMPPRVYSKWLFHTSGIENMANVIEVNKNLMSDWVENGVMYKNAASGVGPLSSATTSFYLDTDPDMALAKYATWQKQHKSGKMIGFDPATVITIITIISAALGAATKFLTELQKKRFMAMAAAEGFGTEAYVAKQSDWDDGILPPTNTESEPNNTMLYVALAAGAYVLMSDE